MTVTIHGGYLPGCIGRIVGMHADYYSREAGFGVAFEAKVARELAAFCEAFDPTRDGLRLALDGGTVIGAVAVDGSGWHGEGAHLRWFIVADGHRGRGIGRTLLGQALAFIRAGALPRACLWTFRGLDAARHLYESHGFRLAEERPGTQWGVLVDEQRFVLRMD